MVIGPFWISHPKWAKKWDQKRPKMAQKWPETEKRCIICTYSGCYRCETLGNQISQWSMHYWKNGKNWHYLKKEDTCFHAFFGEKWPKSGQNGQNDHNFEKGVDNCTVVELSAEKIMTNKAHTRLQNIKS